MWASISKWTLFKMYKLSAYVAINKVTNGQTGIIYKTRKGVNSSIICSCWFWLPWPWCKVTVGQQSQKISVVCCRQLSKPYVLNFYNVWPFFTWRWPWLCKVYNKYGLFILLCLLAQARCWSPGRHGDCQLFQTSFGASSTSLSCCKCLEVEARFQF